MSENIIRLFTMLKAVVACKHHQSLTDDTAELIIIIIIIILQLRCMQSKTMTSV